jgi:predicted methyltransferase
MWTHSRSSNRPLLLLLAAVVIAPCATAKTNPYILVADDAAIARAVANPARPEQHRHRDALRKPAELLAFAGFRPGMRIGEFLPIGAAGIGYFTRIFSSAVGPSGRVYGHVATEQLAHSPRDVTNSAVLEAEKQLINLTILRQPTLDFAPPEQLDLYWTSLNYHDIPLELVTSNDLLAFNKSVFNALKPGGAYVIIDHSAAPGSGMRDLRLHRIDAELVKQQVTAAGFEMDGESSLLANTADTRTLNVFDPAVRGKTDQFVLRFRKPAKAR